MAPKAADCKKVHNPNLQYKNDFLPYFDGFFLSLLKVYDHKIIFSWPLWIFGGKITKKNVSLIFYPKIPNPPPLRPLWHEHIMGLMCIYGTDNWAYGTDGQFYTTLWDGCRWAGGAKRHSR